jgi:hypothetical protein
MPKNSNWPEELFADHKVDDAIETLKSAKSQYILSGTRSAAEKVEKLKAIIEQLHDLVYKS